MNSAEIVRNRLSKYLVLGKQFILYPTLLGVKLKITTWVLLFYLDKHYVIYPPWLDLDKIAILKFANAEIFDIHIKLYKLILSNNL